MSEAKPSRIYLSPPDMSDLERERLLAAFDSNWIAPLGPDVDAFERELAARAGVSDAAALSSGTAALHLALVLLDIGPGDEVWTSTLTFAATANAIRYLGATPVFIDSERESWNMDPELLAEALRDAAARNQLPKAVIVVDLYGNCADYERLCAACEEYDVPLIEDAAEALGSTYRGKPAGSFGVMSALSFNGNKIITTSGGGALLSHNQTLTRRARHLASQARQPTAHYEHLEVGYNYRLSNLLAAVGRAQLERLDHLIAKRRDIHRRYADALAATPGIELIPRPPAGESNHWLCCVLLDEDTLGFGPETIRRRLEEGNIEARPLWKPMHLQPVYSACRVIGDGAVAAEFFTQGLCLPSGSSLSASDQHRVIDVLLGTPGLSSSPA